MAFNGIQNYQYLPKKFYSNEIIYKVIEKKTIDTHEFKSFLATADIKDMSLLAKLIRV